MNRKDHHIPICLILLLCLIGVLGRTAALEAMICTQYGVSPRAISLGNAYSALADDFSASYYNPAGLGTRSRNAIFAGYFYNQPGVKLEGPDGVRSEFDSQMSAFLAGFTMALGPPFTQFLEKVPIPEKYRPDLELTIGVNVIVPSDFKTFVNADTKWPDELFFPVFERAHEMMLIQAGVGAKLHDMVYVGGGVVSGFTCTIEAAYMDFNALDPEAEGYFGYSKLDVNAELEMAPIFGVVLMPWEELRIGAVWRKEMNPVHFKGKVDVTIPTPLGDIHLPSFLASMYAQYLPQQTAFSVSYQVTKKLLAAVEVTFAKWSRYNIPMGTIPLGHPMQDIFIPRGGVEYGLTDALCTRLGYYYQPSPVKNHQEYTQLIDTDQHVFSAGLGYVWEYPEQYIGFPVELDLYFQYQYLPRRTIDTFAGQTSVWGNQMGGGCSLQMPF